jgi:hypothetical protein
MEVGDEELRQLRAALQPARRPFHADPQPPCIELGALELKPVDLQVSDAGVVGMNIIAIKMTTVCARVLAESGNGVELPDYAPTPFLVSPVLAAVGWPLAGISATASAASRSKLIQSW